MKSAKVRFLIASLLALLLYGAEAYAKDANSAEGHAPQLSAGLSM